MVCVCVCEAPLSSCCSATTHHHTTIAGMGRQSSRSRVGVETIYVVSPKVGRRGDSSSLQQQHPLSAVLLFSPSPLHTRLPGSANALSSSPKSARYEVRFTRPCRLRGTYSRFRARPLVELRLSFCVPVRLDGHAVCLSHRGDALMFTTFSLHVCVHAFRGITIYHWLIDLNYWPFHSRL